MTDCNRNDISMASSHYLQYNVNVWHHSMELTLVLQKSVLTTLFKLCEDQAI